MKDELAIDFARARVAHYTERLDSFQRTIERIDRGMTFHESVGQQPMRDVTAERRKEVEELIAVMEDARRMWQAELTRLAAA